MNKPIQLVGFHLDKEEHQAFKNIIRLKELTTRKALTSLVRNYCNAERDAINVKSLEIPVDKLVEWTKFKRRHALDYVS